MGVDGAASKFEQVGLVCFECSGEEGSGKVWGTNGLAEETHASSDLWVEVGSIGLWSLLYHLGESFLEVDRPGSGLVPYRGACGGCH